MDISKLNKTIFVLLFISLSCNTKETSNCDIYVANGEGFVISFQNFSNFFSDKDLKELIIRTKNKKIKYTKWEPEKEGLYLPLTINNYNIGISEKILLKDTLIIDIKDKIIKIYDFTNKIEEGFDESHRKIRFCRYCTSIINNKQMEDQGNNIIIVDLDKL